MKKLIYYSTILFVCIVAFSSCKKYLDINENPNAGEEAPITGLLANVTYSTAYNVFEVSNITSYYTQYLSSPNTGSDIDIYNPIDPNSAWRSVYDDDLDEYFYGVYNVMTDLHDMKIFATEKGLIAYAGVADILMALHLNMASNIWGDIPYSEAFMGISNLTPAFDNQEAVFDTALKLLDEGIAALQQPAAKGQLNGSSDFIHGGYDSAWVKTAHALKARMLNQLSKTGEYNADAILAELTAAYTSNAEDAQVTAFAVRNPWAQVAENNANLNLDGWLSSYFVDATNDKTYGIKDPRLPLITDTTIYGDYRGTPNGKGRTGSGTDTTECYLSVNGWYSSTNSPLQIITYTECAFIKAEAAFRKGDKAAAYTAYLDGIASNMGKLGVESSEAAAYITNPVVAVGANNLTLQLIFKEKYVGCFLSPVTWDDMRRFDYDYKDLTLPQGAVLSDFIRRTSYPSSETSANGGNAPSIKLSDHLWWDQ